MSWSRRAPTAKPGNKTAREKRADTLSLTMPAAAVARNTKRHHHQNSERDARPEKSAYLEKQVWIDSPNVICRPLVSVTCAVKYCCCLVNLVVGVGRYFGSCAKVFHKFFWRKLCFFCRREPALSSPAAIAPSAGWSGVAFPPVCWCSALATHGFSRIDALETLGLKQTVGQHT